MIGREIVRITVYYSVLYRVYNCAAPWAAVHCKAHGALQYFKMHDAVQYCKVLGALQHCKVHRALLHCKDHCTNKLVNMNVRVPRHSEI